MPMTRLARWIASALTAGVLVVGAVAATPEVTPDPVTPGVGPVSVAVVMPFTVPATTTGLIDAETLATYTEADGLLTEQLDAVAGTQVAIGLDPMIVASIRVLGTAAPQSALDFLERLRTVSNEVFMLSYADADPAVIAAASAGHSLSPLGFDFAVEPGNFGPATTPTPTAPIEQTAVPDPSVTGVPADGPPPLPTTEDLLAWPATLESIAWPAEGTVDEEGLAALAKSKYGRVLLSDSNVSAVTTALVDLGDIDAIVADGELTAAVRDASYAATAIGYQNAEAGLISTLQERADAYPGRTIVATLDRRWPLADLRVHDVLNTIEAVTASQLVPLSSVLAGPRGGAQLIEPEPASTTRVEATAQLVEATKAEASYLAISENASLITQPRRLALLGLAAVAWTDDLGAWTIATGDLLADTLATLQSVQIADGSDLLLLSDVSTLRVQVSNALPVPVTVYLNVRPLRPILVVEDSRVEVTIEPDSTTTATVPVESITNGEVTVRAELHSASGKVIGNIQFVKVILQAGWETVGTLIAGSIVVLIFGVGLVRVFLRRRRERAGSTDS